MIYSFTSEPYGTTAIWGYRWETAQKNNQILFFSYLSHVSVNLHNFLLSLHLILQILLNILCCKNSICITFGFSTNKNVVKSHSDFTNNSLEASSWLKMPSVMYREPPLHSSHDHASYILHSHIFVCVLYSLWGFFFPFSLSTSGSHIFLICNDRLNQLLLCSVFVGV